jgi:hypothetical protein
MIPSKKSGEKHPQINESGDEQKSQEKGLKITEKEKWEEQRIWHEIEKDDFSMNILAKSGYKPLLRITNLGWEKAQTKSHTHLSPSLPRAPQNERELPPISQRVC